MKVIISLLITAIIALLGVGGYFVYTYSNQPGDAAEVDASASAASSQDAGSVKGGVKKKPVNEGDVLDNLSAATKMNKDVVAWLRIPGTNINDSVLQAIDNYYYLRRDEDGRDDIYGCYFADFECPLGKAEDYAANTVIYGHSDLKDNPEGPRFSELFKFLDPTFASSTPYIYVTTLDETTTWQVFSAFYTDTSLNYIKVHLTPQEVTALTDEAVKNSVFDFGVGVSSNDKIITLSTCSVKNGTDGNQRFVVMAKQLTDQTANLNNATDRQ